MITNNFLKENRELESDSLLQVSKFIMHTVYLLLVSPPIRRYMCISGEIIMRIISVFESININQAIHILCKSVSPLKNELHSMES